MTRRQPMQQSVIVVGAGIAGLTAAWHLRRAGCEVTVIEAQDQPGGRVGARETRGIRYNTGARLLYAFSKDFNRLLDDIGLTPDLIPVRNLSAECRSPTEKWKVELMPGPRSLLTPGLTLADRLRFMTYGARLLAARFTTDPDDATSAPAADAVTLADYITRHLGPRVLERMVNPVFRSTRSWDAADISAAFFATTMPHMIGTSTVHVLKGGMNSLPQALSRDLTLLLNTRALRIDAPASGPCRVEAEQDGAPLILEADRIVCAVEGVNVAALIPDMAPEDRAFMDRVRYNSLGIAHIRLNRQVAPYMSFFSDNAGGTIATYQQIPGVDAQGSHPQLYTQLTPEANRRARNEGLTDRIDEIVADDLRCLYPTLDADRVDHFNQWIALKLPEFYPGYAGEVRRFLNRQPGAKVQFCGDYLAQSLVTGAAASGKAAALRLLAA
ncbi:FAD-dependent oxidoreductase [uncultured Paracoccus sp.]|uniref:protoporphyrinogen/coproporphyrinogen oxidase n=1 Tax=uncultured Paracoccus sp. TaxID=189685 RepID=UPI0034246E3C